MMRYKFALGFVLLAVGMSYADYPADLGSRGVDWGKVRRKVDEHGWARDIVKRLADEVKETRRLYEHPPLGTTGWFHHYFCSDDAQRLTFDPKKPYEHKCPECGKVYSGPPYDYCWNSSVHSYVIRATEYAAILYRVTGDKQYLNYAREVLLWYADNYDKFEVHGRHAGKGRIRSQSLDEATHLVTLVKAYWDICPDLKPAERKKILEKYFIPDAKFIHAQTGTIHNIHSWHNCAVGLVGFVSGDDELAIVAIDGPFGMKKQIEKGVKEDGFWYEGSIGYHFYTIRSIEPLYLAARAQGYDLAGTDKFLLMYSGPLDFTFSDGEFPANNDGWPEMNIGKMAAYYETAASLSDDSQIRDMLSRTYAKGRRSVLEALLYGPSKLDVKTNGNAKSVLFKDSGVAILRNEDINVYLKFGPYGGGHDHNDRLNMILFGNNKVLIPDLGTSGYGIVLNGKWFRSSAAHNMLVVDGKRQRNCSGYLVSYRDDSVTAGVKDAYPGVDIRRKITLADDGIVETVTADSDKSHTYDLFYHVRGNLSGCSVATENVEGFSGSNGYNMLSGLKKAVCRGAVELKFDLRDTDGSIIMRLEADKEYELYVGGCPDNPANKKMSVVMLRRRDNEAKFTGEITVLRN